MTPMEAIRAKCLDCCYDSAYEVRMCGCKDCPLYDFRFGKNPNIKLSEAERKRRSEQAKNSALIAEKAPNEKIQTKRVLSPEEKAILAERLTAKGEKTEKQQNTEGAVAE